jgi:drug/metabolite transporter (DMT)-like permease
LSLDPFVVAVVLLAALLHASWNALVKAVADPVATLAVLQLTGMVIGLVLIPFLPLPEATSWPFLLVSTLLHLLYQLLLILSYRAGDLSQVYPVACGPAPLLVALLALPLLGERPSSQGAVGILVIASGLLALALRRRGVTAESRKALLYAAANGCVIAAYTLTDAQGVRLSGNSWSYIAWLSVFEGPPLTLVVLWRWGPRALPRSWRTLWPGVVGGTLGLVAYALVLWAFQHAPVAVVAALRETSVLFATVIGSRMLGEPFGGARLAAASVVLAGVVLIQTG